MTNLLDLVPALQRQLGTYASRADTESQLAAYLADGIQALMLRWDRTYSITFVEPMTFLAAPNIEQQDYRPVILAASIIYKGARAAGLAAITDGDFSYVPLKGTNNPIEQDRKELLAYIGATQNLASATSAPLRGYAYVFNKESYNTFLLGGWITDGII